MQKRRQMRIQACGEKAYEIMADGQARVVNIVRSVRAEYLEELSKPRPSQARLNTISRHHRPLQPMNQASAPC
jgi:hypothetical protein